MSDHNRTIEFLRDFRASGVQVVTDEVREAAAAYANLCAAANERLRQCALLMQKGLRAEAVHAAEAPPNLLDLVAALDLPDPEGWVEMCQRNDMPVPPPLMMDRAAQLNDAYGQDQPLAQLYANHRRMALARGPLAERLSVMRQLATADPGPFWDKDIRTFEAARFKELRVAFAVAAKEKDVVAFKTLTAEVLHAPWAEVVPPDLASMAKEIDDKANQAAATSQVSEVLLRLRAAFAARNLSDCSSLLDQLKDQSATLGVATLNDDAAADIRAAASWVQQQKESLARRKAYADACDALADALNNDAPDRDLAMAVQAIANQGKSAPEELQAKYDAKLRARAKAARMRNIGIIAGVAAVLALGFGGFYWYTQQGVAKEWAARIEKAVADGNADLAKKLVAEQESLAPGASGDPKVAAAKKSAATLAEQADRDRDWVRGTVSIITAASTRAGTALGGNSPDEWWTASLTVDEALGQVGKPQDAKRVDPKGQVAAAVERLKAERQSLRNRYASWLVAQIDAADRKAGSTDVAPRAADIADAEAALADAEKDLSAVRPQLDRGGDAARAAMDAVAPRMTAIRDAIRRAKDEHDARRQLPESAGSIASARQALRQFATRFPQSPLAADFTQAAQSLDVHESMERYIALVAAWSAEPTPRSEKIARERLDALRQFIGENPHCPLNAFAAEYAEYLQQAAVALAVSGNAWQIEMGDILNSPLMSELSFLEATDKTRYYVLGDPAVQKEGIGTRTRVIFDSIDAQNLARKKTITLLAPKTLVSEKAVLLPHALFVREMAEKMKTVDDRAWETWGVDQVDRLIAADTLDPVVRAILLRDLLRATSRVIGWGAADLYDRSIADFERQKLDNIVWYDLTNPVPPVTVENLRGIVAKIPRGDVAKKLLAQRKAEIFASLKPPLVGTAMLLRDESGKWQLSTAPGTATATIALAVRQSAGGAAPTSSAPAVPDSPAPPPDPNAPAPPPGPAVVPPAATGGAARLVKVATLAGGTWTIDEAAVRDQPQGTVVFLSR